MTMTFWTVPAAVEAGSPSTANAAAVSGAVTVTEAVAAALRLAPMGPIDACTWKPNELPGLLTDRERLAGMGAAFAASRTWREAEPEVAVMGACLLAAMLSTLAMMAAGSFGTILALMVWILTGLLLSYAAMPQPTVSTIAETAPAWDAAGLAGAAARLRP